MDSIGAPFDAGCDTATQVSTATVDPSLYAPALDRLIIRVGDGAEVPPRALGTGVY